MMARPTISEQLVANEVVELVLPNGTVLVLSTEGLDLQDVSLGPPTKNYVNTTGRGFAMRYENDGTETWSVSLTVGHSTPDSPVDTDQLFDWAGHQMTIRRYPFGKESGKKSLIGPFWARVAKARNGEKMAIALSGPAAGDLVIGTVA